MHKFITFKITLIIFILSIKICKLINTFIKFNFFIVTKKIPKAKINSSKKKLELLYMLTQL